MGVITTFILAPQIIIKFTETFGKFQGWILVGLTLGLIGGGSFLLSILGSREKKEDDPNYKLDLEYFRGYDTIYR